MKINIVKLIFDGDVSYKILNADYCCERLKANPMIDVFYEYVEDAYKNSSVCELDDDTGCCLGMMIKETDTYPEPYETLYETDYRYYPIQFCPHCGEKIEINIVKTVDVTDKYLALHKESEDLRIKCNATDSKKEETELQRKRCAINYKMDKFFEVSNYEEEIFGKL